MVDFASGSGLVATYINWSHVRPAGYYGSQLWPSREKNLSKCFDLNGVGALGWFLLRYGFKQKELGGIIAMD